MKYNIPLQVRLLILEIKYNYYNVSQTILLINHLSSGYKFNWNFISDNSKSILQLYVQSLNESERKIRYGPQSRPWIMISLRNRATVWQFFSIWLEISFKRRPILLREVPRPLVIFGLERLMDYGDEKKFFQKFIPLNPIFE